MNELNWNHIFVEGAVYLFPTLLALYLGYRKLLWVLTEYRPHRHSEREGTLNVDGISYSRTMNGGGN